MNVEVREIPEEHRRLAEEYREKLIEAVAEFDEEFMEKYLNGEELSVKKLKQQFVKQHLDVEFYPVVCGTAFKNKGVQLVLDAVIDYLPSPIDIPPMTGIKPDTEEEVTRPADDNGHSRHLRLKL